MKSLSQSTFIFLIIIFSQLTSASGQRTTVITTDVIKSYQDLSISKDKTHGKKLHYIGTVNNKTHILMVTKLSRSKRSDGRIGIPWSHIFKYKISVNKMTIVNGWDITDIVKQGIKVRPSDCPRVYLSTKRKEYTIPSKKRVKSKCIPTRNHYDEGL